MYNWEEFYGCIDLGENDIIDFLLYMENSERMNTDEGKFLHNQYMRELMLLKGININTLEPTNGNINFYNLRNLKSEYDCIKNNPTSLLMAWKMRVDSYKHWIKLIDEPYIPLRINSMKDGLNIIYKNINNVIYIEDVIDIIVENMWSIILISDKVLLNKKYNDVVFKNNNREYDMTLHKILKLWCNGDAVEKHECGKDIYVYNANILNLSFKYKWKGYCISCGLVEGESTTSNKLWINMNGESKIGFFINYIKENHNI